MNEEEQLTRRIARMIESIPDVFLSVDKRWRITYANREAEKIFEKRREELLGKNMWNVFPNMMVSSFQNDYFKAIAEQRAVEFEEYLPVYDKWFEVHATPFSEGLCIYFHDITERKKTDERLLRALETNNHLAAAIANTVTGVTISDPSMSDNPLIFANKGFELLTGYTVQEVLGHNCRFLQGEETDGETLDLIRQAMRKRQPITAEVLNYRKDGSYFWNELTISPVLNEAGELLYFVGLQADVTRRKQAEQKLQAELELAKAVQQSVLSPPLYEPHIEVEAVYIPSEELAGDMYCWYKIDSHRYGILLLDVVGHGISASLIGMSVRSLLQGLITRLADPVKVIKELNRHMRNLYAKQQKMHSYYFTCIYVVVNTKEKIIEYVNAGHPPGIMCTVEGKSRRLERGSLPVGLLSDFSVEKEVLSYQTSARIVLYTDGLIEGKNQAALQVIDKLQQFFSRHHHTSTAKAKELAIQTFVTGKKKDDVCLLVITVR